MFYVNMRICQGRRPWEALLVQDYVNGARKAPFNAMANIAWK